MKIIIESIKKLEEKGTTFYELSRNLSCSYNVGIINRAFSYEIINNEVAFLSIENFKEIFNDWASGEPYTEKKIKGTLKVCNYIDSIKKINTNFTDENSQLLPVELLPNIEKFWNEVSNYFTLPPTHVFFYDPDFDSAFTCGVYWQFCYIYLNDTTKQGIVLSAYATD